MSSLLRSTRLVFIIVENSIQLSPAMKLYLQGFSWFFKGWGLGTAWWWAWGTTRAKVLSSASDGKSQFALPQDSHLKNELRRFNTYPSTYLDKHCSILARMWHSYLASRWTAQSIIWSKFVLVFEAKMRNPDREIYINFVTEKCFCSSVEFQPLIKTKIVKYSPINSDTELNKN